jgi:peptide/nickel transport system substrate-binding protein
MRQRSLHIVLAAAAMLVFSAAPSFAKGCVRILGFESEGEKESMDPGAQVGSDNAYHLRAVYEPLVARDNHMQPVPVLAKSWESNQDATVWTFHLKRGVKFHNGADFGARDVVYTFRRLLDPKISPGAAGVLSFLDPDGIQAIDPHTVRITVKRPVAELPVLTATKFSLIVPDGAKPEDLRLHGVGTGPFVQERFTPNGAVRVLRRNPNYWQAGLPKADCLEIKVSVEPLSRTAAILAGEADLALLVDPTTLATLESNPKVTLLRTPAATALYMPMFIDTPPFSDPRVRKAMKLVVDRDAAVKTVLLGFGEPGNDEPVPPSSPDAYQHTVIPRDVETAKKLLAEAGHANGLEIDLYTADSFPGMVQLAEVYSQMARDAGIKVSVVKAPADSYWDDIWMKKPFVVSYVAARPTGEALALNLNSNSKWNESRWFRKDYDELLAKAAATVNTDERRKIYQQAERLVADEGGVILPVFNIVVAALRKECTGYTPNVDTNSYDFSNLRCD